MKKYYKEINVFGFVTAVYSADEPINPERDVEIDEDEYMGLSYDTHEESIESLPENDGGRGEFWNE